MVPCYTRSCKRWFHVLRAGRSNELLRRIGDAQGFISQRITTVLFFCSRLHYSHAQECGTPGVELLSGALRDQPNAFMDQLDLTFKWVSLRLCEKENVKAMGQVRTQDIWSAHSHD